MSPRKAKVVEPEAKAEPTYDEIALRAYEIHESGDGSDEFENWLRAEHELTADRYPGAT